MQKADEFLFAFVKGTACKLREQLSKDLDSNQQSSKRDRLRENEANEAAFSLATNMYASQLVSAYVNVQSGLNQLRSAPNRSKRCGRNEANEATLSLATDTYAFQLIMDLSLDFKAGPESG